jgi:multidrug efflux pump subunit AcrA (membrane-fusion protein)
VFVVENGRVREVAVETGPFTGNRVTVSGRLKAGDRVVVSGNASLTDGKSVEVRS